MHTLSRISTPQRLLTAALKTLSILVLVLLLTGCELPSFGGAGKILFQDDFSDANSGWDSTSGYDGYSNYKDDGYRIFVDDINKDAYSNPGLNFSDIIIEVEATVMGGPELNDYGVICRLKDDNAYYFILSSTGNYIIAKRTTTGQDNLSIGELPGGKAALKTDGPNLIRAECVGSRLALFLNGQAVAETTDEELKSGDVGLFAGTFETPGTDVLFDNFVIKQP
jgi:hypothetical protein